jgi:hypothetical protein
MKTGGKWIEGNAKETAHAWIIGSGVSTEPAGIRQTYFVLGTYKLTHYTKIIYAQRPYYIHPFTASVGNDDIYISQSQAERPRMKWHKQRPLSLSLSLSVKKRNLLKKLRKITIKLSHNVRIKSDKKPWCKHRVLRKLLALKLRVRISTTEGCSRLAAPQHLWHMYMAGLFNLNYTSYRTEYL